MALLSAGSNSGSSASSSISISPKAITSLIIIIVFGLLIAGLIWLVISIVNLLQEKEKYYRELRKKLGDKSDD